MAGVIQGKSLKEGFHSPNLVRGLVGMDRLQTLADQKKSVKIVSVYPFGSEPSIEVVKRGLFMMELHERLVNEGCETYSTWVVEDHQVREIGDDSERDIAGEQVLNGMNFLDRLNQVYGGCAAQVSSLNLRNMGEYMRVFEKFKAIGEVSGSGLEELATFVAMDTDVRISSEQDAPVKIATFPSELVDANPYATIYLTQTSSANFKINPVWDDLDKVRELISETEDKRALLDLCLVGKMARDRLNTPNFPTSFLSVHPDDFSLSSLKDNSLVLYEENVHPYLNRS